MNHPLRNKEKRKIYWYAYAKRFDKSEKKFNKELQKFLREQEERVISSLDNQVKGLEDEIFNLSLEIKLSKEALLPVLEEIALESGEDTLDFFGINQPINFSTELDNTLDKRANLFCTSINETTFQQLKNTFAASFAEGETRSQLIDRVQELYGEISRGRAANIVRTEVQVAVQSGQFDAYRQVGIEIKIWVATPDGRTRDSHAMTDGEEVPLNATFSNGLLYPGDPSAPPEEVVNCRCTI